jgi:hypothetical protein
VFGGVGRKTAQTYPVPGAGVNEWDPADGLQRSERFNVPGEAKLLRDHATSVVDNPVAKRHTCSDNHCGTVYGKAAIILSTLLKDL